MKSEFLAQMPTNIMYVLAPAVLLTQASQSLLAQGSISLDNSVVTNRVSIDSSGNFYLGTFGMEVWQSSNVAPSLSASLDLTAMTDNQAAYNMLIAYGFRLERSYASKFMSQGTFFLDEIRMAGVSPPGSTVTLALVAWNSSAGSWDAAIASGAKGGLIAFVQRTANYAMATPPVAPDLNWTVPQDLVMMTIVPEPLASELVVFGAALFLLLRHRRMNSG